MQTIVHTFYLCGHVLHCLRTNHKDTMLVSFDIIGSDNKSNLWLAKNDNEMFAWFICKDLLKSLFLVYPVY